MPDDRDIPPGNVEITLHTNVRFRSLTGLKHNYNVVL